MSLCRYDTSKICKHRETSSRTCIDCTLDQIKEEIEEYVIAGACYDEDGLEIYRSALNIAIDIINKYRK